LITYEGTSAPSANWLAFHVTVTEWLETDPEGTLPVEAVIVFERIFPFPKPVGIHALRPTPAATSTASARSPRTAVLTAGIERIGVGDQALLAPVTVTGTVKTAAWHVLSEALLIETELGTVSVAVAPAPTSSVRPLWFVNVTPVEASHAAPLSEVIVLLPETAVTRTGKEFGFVRRSLRSPVAPA
jgi:hypothetical protein